MLRLLGGVIHSDVSSVILQTLKQNRRKLHFCHFQTEYQLHIYICFHFFSHLVWDSCSQFHCQLHHLSYKGDLVCHCNGLVNHSSRWAQKASVVVYLFLGASPFRCQTGAVHMLLCLVGYLCMKLSKSLLWVSSRFSSSLCSWVLHCRTGSVTASCTIHQWKHNFPDYIVNDGKTVKIK